MPEHEKNFKEQILNITRQTGAVLTPTQLKILDVFHDTSVHVNASQLTDMCREKGIDTDEESVKQMLDLFVRYGAALRHEFHLDGVVSEEYEHRHLTDHHDHLACVKCGGVQDIFDARLEDAQSDACRANGFSPLWHRTVIYGICSQCAGQREPTLPLSFASRGERVIVKQIRGGDTFKRRLTDMGIIPNLELEVLNNDGPMLVAARDSRVALGMGMAAKIMVSPKRD
jgi:Fur family ferric uptake transcriptional regulator